MSSGTHSNICCKLLSGLSRTPRDLPSSCRDLNDDGSSWFIVYPAGVVRTAKEEGGEKLNRKEHSLSQQRA